VNLRRFGKHRKNDAQMDPEMDQKWSKIDPWGHPWSIYSSFLWILGGVEKS
jgi:hypothetical protein